MMGGGMMGGGGGGVMGGPPFVTLRWQSALPIKQAIARFRYKDEVKTSQEAADSLTREEEFHILGVIGLPGQQQNYIPQHTIDNSMLIFGKRPDLHPVKVIPQMEGGKVSLYLFFPKFNEDGTPTITEKDRKMEVFVTAWMYDISKKFGLGDMVYQGKLDF